MEFIRAGINFTDELRKIAHESEAYWGYDHGYMTKFDSLFNITKEFIAMHTVYLGQQDGKIRCFWGILRKSDYWELEYFYISCDSIGEGCGRKMWLHMINWCMENHVEKIQWVTSVLSSSSLD